MSTNPPTGTTAPTPEILASARKLFADLGTTGAAERLGVSTSSFLRIVAGAPVRRGTLALAAAAIGAAR